MNKKAFWISILAGVLILLAFVLVSNVIQVGERLFAVHAYLAYAFYALAFLLLYILVLNPLRVIFFAPTFTIDPVGTDKQRMKAYHQAAKTLMRSKNIKEEERQALKEALNDDDKLPGAIKAVFNGSIRKEIDQIIIKHSKTVLVTTAISQNGNLDMFAVIFTNLRMVKAIVEACGFRPNIANLAKLSVNVAVTALIAEGLEDVNFSNLMPSKVGEAMTDMPFLRTMTNSVFQGVSNGILTCRVGVVTRKYLFQENRLMSLGQLRLTSYKESFRLMPIIITEGLASFPKGIVSFAMRPFKKNPFDAKEETA